MATCCVTGGSRTSGKWNLWALGHERARLWGHETIVLPDKMLREGLTRRKFPSDGLAANSIDGCRYPPFARNQVSKSLLLVSGSIWGDVFVRESFASSHVPKFRAISQGNRTYSNSQRQELCHSDLSHTCSRYNGMLALEFDLYWSGPT